MSTTMYRLQISLPPKQVEFLRQRARNESSSIANVIRELIERESEKEYHLTAQDIANVKSMAGRFEDTMPLINGIPVSQNVDLYLAQAMLDTHSPPKPSVREKKAVYRVRRTKTKKTARAKR